MGGCPFCEMIFELIVSNQKKKRMGNHTPSIYIINLIVIILMATTNQITNGSFETGTFFNWISDNAVITTSSLPPGFSYGALLTAAPAGTASITEAAHVQRAGRLQYVFRITAKSNISGSTLTLLLNGVPYSGPAAINPVTLTTSYQNFDFTSSLSGQITLTGDFTVGFRLNNESGVVDREATITNISMIFGTPLPTTSIQNPDFELEDKFWTFTNAVAKDTFPVHSGTFSCSIGAGGSIIQTVLTTAGTPYYLTLWTYVNSGTSTLTATANGNPMTSTPLLMTNTGVYQQYILTFTANHWYTNLYFSPSSLTFVDDFAFTSAFDYEFLTNPSFETGSLTPGWTGTNITVNTSDPHQGIYAAHLLNNTSVITQSDIPLDNGNTYQLSFWYNLLTPIAFRLNVTINGISLPGAPFLMSPGVGYSNFVATFVATGTSTLQVRPIGLVPLGGYDLAIDNFNLNLIALACYRGDTYFKVKDIETGEITDLPVSDIYSRHHLIYEDSSSSFLPIVHIAVFPQTTRFIKIGEVYLTAGHKVVIDGVEIKAKDVPGRSRVKTQPHPIFTLILEKRGIVKERNGLAIVADGISEWNNFISTRKSKYHLQ
jgi:hypothetical protein